MSLLGNLLLLAAWVCTHQGVVAWIAAHYARGDRRLEACLMAAVLVLAWRRSGGPLPLLRRLGAPAAIAPGPLGLLAGCLLVELLADRWLDLHLLRAFAFVIGGYALAGLYAEGPAWRAAFPWIGLLALTLPFGAFSEVYLGFPARLFTAELVAAGLDAAGIAQLSRDTILVFDGPGGPAALQVDVPCAGVRSLWSMAIFLLAAAAVEGRRLDRRFVAAVLVTGGLVVAANTLRVAALVVIGGVLNAPALAAAVHVPLGLLGFAWSAAAGWGLLSLGAGRESTLPTLAPGHQRSAGIAPLLAGLVCALAVVAPPVAASPSAESFSFELPSGWDATAVAPVPSERGFFAEMGGLPPQKWRFAVEPAPELSGSLLVLPSRRWRAHHQPEACLLAQGLTVEALRTVILGADFPVRVAQVGGGAATGVWWFQSPTRVTEDFAVRTWAAVSGAETRWVLVSILLDGPVEPSDPTTRAALASLRSAVHAALRGSPPPPEEAACPSSAPC